LLAANVSHGYPMFSLNLNAIITDRLLDLLVRDQLEK
jgi:hypothetical protein